VNYFEYYKKLLTVEEYIKLEKSLKAPFRKSIRVNTLKISLSDFKILAEKNDWLLEQINWCNEGYFIDRENKEKPLGKSIYHHGGIFYIQEASSMLPVEIFSNIKSDDLILDLASAPGSKLTQIAAKSKNIPFLIANEPSGMRVKALVSNIKRMGIVNSLVVQKDPQALAKILPNTFSKIMLDAPCSGDGMIRRDIKTLDRWNYNKVKFQAGVQKRLIEEAFKLLKPGGELIYSTCTLTKEEDEQILEHLTTTYSSAKLMEIKMKPFNKNTGYIKIFPYQFDTEGFFVSKITKTEATKVPSDIKIKVQKENKSKKWDFLISNKINIIKDCFLSNFEFDFNFDNDRNLLIEKNGEAWIWPEAAYKLMKSLHPVYSGIKIGKFVNNGFIPSHSFCSTYGYLFKKNILEVEEEQGTSFLKGQDLTFKQNSGYYLIKSRNIILGIGKSDGNYIKNKLPRDLVIC
jgi:16S rRNA (cytosine1407-C5)-methyltransferase